MLFLSKGVMDAKEPLESSFEGPFPFENILLFPISIGPLCLEGFSNIQIKLRRER